MSMLEAMKSQTKCFPSKKTSESDVVKTSDSAQAAPKSGPSNQPDPIPTRSSIPRASDHSDFQPMDTDFYGPPLPPQSQNVQSEQASKQSDIESDHSEHHSKLEHPRKVVPKAKKHSDKRKHKARAKYYSQSSSSEEEESSASARKPTKPQHKFPQEP